VIPDYAAKAGTSFLGRAVNWTQCRETVRSAFGIRGSAGWALVDQCVVSAANFLTIYVFARNLGAAEFGAYMLAYTGLMLLTSVQSALLIQPHNVLGAALSEPEYRRFTGALVLAQIVSCAAVCVALGAAGWVCEARAGSAAGGVLVALALAAAPWMGQEFVRRVLYTRSESRAAAQNDMLTYGLQLAGACALIRFWPGRVSPQHALAILGVSSVAGVLLGVVQLRSHVCFGGRGGFEWIRRTWRDVWHFGKWLTAQNVLVCFGAHGHSWIVALMLGADQVGLYRAATHLVNLMNPLLQTAFSYLPSRGSLVYHAGGVAGLATWVRKVSWLSLLAIVPFCIVLVGFPGQVLHLAYGGRYAGTDLPLILALATVGQCILFEKFPFDIGLLALRSTKSIFTVYLIPIFLLLTSGITLIHFLGILGVPLSSIVINTALLIATSFAYRRRLAQAVAA
jgi:O-antigen/teichoic acid export membrane protein